MYKEQYAKIEQAPGTALADELVNTAGAADLLGMNYHTLCNLRRMENFIAPDKISGRHGTYLYKRYRVLEFKALNQNKLFTLEMRAAKTRQHKNKVKVAKEHNAPILAQHQAQSLLDLNLAKQFLSAR